MDPCTDPRHRQTWAYMPKARKRRADRLLIAVLVLLAAIAFGAFASKALANAAHMSANHEIQEGY